MKSTLTKKDMRILDSKELGRLKEDINHELTKRSLKKIDNTDIPNPVGFQGLKSCGENYDMFRVEQIRDAIKSWILYFNRLGKYFEEQGNQERADRHYAQAIAFETFLGEELDKVNK